MDEKTDEKIYGGVESQNLYKRGVIEGVWLRLFITLQKKEQT